ncbi:MAG: SDR family oxidoreductase [Alphaproteobacteria bacterium]|nr:SDR family oxidoreductase [Alphaproteobacteria bacterium]
MGVMIVTGAGRGIGAAIARMAGAKGWDVAVNYSRAKDKAEAVATAIRATGRRAIAVRGDVASETDVVAMFQRVDAELGPVDALVNNAGVDYECLVGDIERPGIERVLGVNVVGLMLCSREAVRRMSTARGGKGGAIVHIGSISARTGGLPKDCVYTASKGAVDAFTHALSNEVAREGIRVACVRPGLIQTEIFDTNLGLEQVKELAKRNVPMGRIGQPEEIAAMTCWLCSAEASYVSGFIYDVSGGR